MRGEFELGESRETDRREPEQEPSEEGTPKPSPRQGRGVVGEEVPFAIRIILTFQVSGTPAVVKVAVLLLGLCADSWPC